MKIESANVIIWGNWNMPKIYNSFFIYILFLTIVSMCVIPGYAASTIYEHNNTSGNDDCNICHFSPHGASFKQEQNLQTKPGIKSIPVTQANLQTLEETNVLGNITLIASMGQDWYQQGIFGSSGSPVGVDKSWGWTFFDENTSSGYISPSENVTQRNNIYTLLLDDGNNSNPITGAQVVANVTYWLYYGGNGTTYQSFISSVNLTEDAVHRGLYNGRFDFYGGTDGTSGCSYCHDMHGGDAIVGYFPGNYTVSIRAEVNTKIVTKNLNFEVTPWGCEDCHGSGSRHKSSAPDRHIVGMVDMDSACYLCHGINEITGMYDAGNPHQNTAHRNIKCEDCHTNKSISSQYFTGVNFTTIDNKPIPQYNKSVIKLNGVTHTNLTCTDCHGNLTLSNPEGGYNSSNYSFNEVVNNYDPSFTSVRQFLDYYVINVTGEGFQNITFNWSGDSNVGFYLYPPNFNPQNFTNLIIYDGSTFTNKPKIYSNNAPAAGLWILQIYGYNLNPDWTGNLQPQINYSINSTYPIQQKDFPSTPECNSCHNSKSSGKAFTNDQIPDWNPGFAHVDTNGDGAADIQCRMCHNSMHEITVKDCDNCHTTAPTTHPINEPEFGQYIPAQCLTCHGDPHNVTKAGGTDCIACHSAKDVNISIFGVHANTNTSDGAGNITNLDCWTCHYQKDMNRSNIFSCTNCHVDGAVLAPLIINHRPGGTAIRTTANCTICHNNSINKFYANINESISHYGTNTYLTKPTVNQTLKPHFGFMTSGDAFAYNKECNSCHNPSNSSYGNGTLITKSHTGLGTCNGCHVNGSASDLHNSSLGMPLTTSCRSCHTAYASKYNAPNLTGTPMVDYSTCNGGNCHGTDISNSLDTLARHNADRTYPGTGGSTDTVYLNNNVSLTVTKGTPVEVTARIKDAPGAASRVGGAEYYIDVDPGQGKGIPMSAMDGFYDATRGNWENINATLDTSSLSDGNHTIYVWGVDIGKQWSALKNATLIVQSLEYINGTVTSSGVPLAGAIITTAGANTTTSADGNFSLSLSPGTYNITAGKQPTHYDNTSTGVVVAPGNTTIILLDLAKKPTGNISGVVSSV